MVFPGRGSLATLLAEKIPHIVSQSRRCETFAALSRKELNAASRCALSFAKKTQQAITLLKKTYRESAILMRTVCWGVFKIIFRILGKCVATVLRSHLSTQPHSV